MSDDPGTLYVLANRDGSLAKVGMTRNGTPDARANDYARQHGIQWHVYWSAVTCNVANAEAGAHRALQDRRFSLTPEAREIFHCTPQHARRIAERFIIAPSPGAPPRINWQLPRAAWLNTAAIGLALILRNTNPGTPWWPTLRWVHRTLRIGR